MALAEDRLRRVVETVWACASGGLYLLFAAVAG